MLSALRNLMRNGRPSAVCQRLAPRLREKARRDLTAWYAVANRDYAGAIQPLREIIARYPLEIEAYGRLGRVLESA